MNQTKSIAQVQAACTGDEEAFAQLVLAHQRTVIGIAYAVTNSQAAVDDLVQDTFLVAWKNLGSLQDPECFTAWLCSITRNLSKNWIRSEVYRRALTKAYAEESRESATASGYRQLMQSERYAHLRKMLESVSPPLREAMVLFYLEDFSIKEIAGVLEITSGNAKKRLERGRNELRGYFEQDWKDHFDSEASSDKAVSNKVMATLAIGPAMPLSAYLSTGSLAAVPTSLSLSPVPTTLWKGVLNMSTPKVVVTASVVLLSILAALYFKSPTAPVLQENASIPLVSAPVNTLPVKEPAPTDPVLIPIESGSTENVLTNTIASNETDEKKLDDPIISTISGTVYDEWENPVPGADVTVVFASVLPRSAPIGKGNYFDSQRGKSENQYSIVTNKSGVYTLTGDFENTVGRLLVRSDTAKGNSVFDFNIARTNGVIDTLDVVIEEGTFLLGQLLSANGQPISGAYIRDLLILGENRGGLGGSNDYAVTDENGIFELIFHTSGTAAIHIVTAEEQTIMLDIPVGQADIITLRIEDASSLSGTITRADGSPGKGLWLTLDSEYSMGTEGITSVMGGTIENIFYTQTRDDGSYEFPTVASGLFYKISIIEPENNEENSGLPLTPKIDLGALETGETKEWDYTINAPIRITGVVRGEPSGNPIEGIDIKLSLDSKPEAQTQSDGTYEITSYLDSGELTIWPMYQHTMPKLLQDVYGKTYTINPGEEVDVSFTLPDPSQIHFRVVDTNGTPIQKAEVSFTFQPDENSKRSGSGNSYTDSDGKFSWSIPPIGKSSFSFYSPEHSLAESHTYLGISGKKYPEETIVLYPRASIEGYILNMDGNPLTRKTLEGSVQVEGEPNFRHMRINTLDDGYFSIKDDLYLPATLVEMEIYFYRRGKRVGIWSNDSIQLQADTITNLGDIQLTAPEE